MFTICQINLTVIDAILDPKNPSTNPRACCRGKRTIHPQGVVRVGSPIEIGIDQDDVLLLLQHLEAGDFSGRLRSSITNEWLYVFKPKVAATVLYLKVAIREHCIVVSLHEDKENGND